MEEIRVSKKFSNLLMNRMFEKVDNKSKISTIVKWCIDSKYRKYVYLNKFLKEQLNNPPLDLLAFSKKFKNIRDYDIRIVAILREIHKIMTYTSDGINYGKNEYWATGLESLKKLKGDCDDFGILLYITARLTGIPAHRIYCAIGNVKEGGHFYNLYLSSRQHEIYSMDGTYYYDDKEIMDDNNILKRRVPFRLNTNKYVNIWYIFNEENVWK